MVLFALETLVSASALIFVILWALSRGHYVSHINGPKGGEWLVGECLNGKFHAFTDSYTAGHEHIITNQKEAVDVQFKASVHSQGNDIGTNFEGTNNSGSRSLGISLKPRVSSTFVD